MAAISQHFRMHFREWKLLSLNLESWVLDKISVIYVPWGVINNIVPLSEAMVVCFTDAYICVTRPQWVNVKYFQAKLTAVIMPLNCIKSDETLTHGTASSSSTMILTIWDWKSISLLEDEIPQYILHQYPGRSQYSVTNQCEMLT